jgi:hypothetical protein
VYYIEHVRRDASIFGSDDNKRIATIIQDYKTDPAQSAIWSRGAFAKKGKFGADA